jgi:hypothetical protein
MKLGNGILYFNTHHSASLIDGTHFDRPIMLCLFQNVTLSGWDFSYPNLLINEFGSDCWYLPVKESFMSLGRDSNYESSSEWFPGERARSLCTPACSRPAFFFAYNLSNFYHFMYDTLPYLNGYLFLKERGLNPALLVGQTGNDGLPGFVIEALQSFGIDIEKDLLYASPDIILDHLYVVSSYTHDGLSQYAPHHSYKAPLERIIEQLKLSCPEKPFNVKPPSRIYISRRTWSSGDVSNIGTNYTERRKFCNEDDIVDELEKLDFTEIFTESLSLAQKIDLFSNAQIVIAPTGGGLANLLLASQSMKVILINSPLFWDTNKRLRFAFGHLDVLDFNDTTFIDYVQPVTSGTDQLSAQGGLNSPWGCDTSSFIEFVKANLSLAN